MFVMVSLHVLAFFWVRRRLDFLFMLACGVVRCFSLSIGELVYYKLQNKIFSYFILGTVPSIRSAKIINSHQTIGKHINNALKEELDDEPVVAKFATTAADGKIS